MGTFELTFKCNLHEAELSCGSVIGGGQTLKKKRPSTTDNRKKLKSFLPVIPKDQVV